MFCRTPAVALTLLVLVTATPCERKSVGGELFEFFAVLPKTSGVNAASDWLTASARSWGFNLSVRIPRLFSSARRTASSASTRRVDVGGVPGTGFGAG